MNFRSTFAVVIAKFAKNFKPGSPDILFVSHKTETEFQSWVFIQVNSKLKQNYFEDSCVNSY